MKTRQSISPLTGTTPTSFNVVIGAGKTFAPFSVNIYEFPVKSAGPLTTMWISTALLPDDVF